jgi:hypothetical protein
MAPESMLSSLEYEIRDNVAVWHIKDFETLYQQEMEEGEQLYLEKSGNDEITATVVRFDGAPTLGAEEQGHINEVWSELAQAVDVKKAAYVGEGISALAVKSNVEAPDVKIESFGDLGEAVDWAQTSG